MRPPGSALHPLASSPPPSLLAWSASALKRLCTETPTGRPRLPGRAPGGSRGPQGARGPERPLARGPARPAPCPPLSRLPPPPAWVILRLGALRGRSPETPSSTSLPPALLLLPTSPRSLFPARGPKSALQPSPVGHCEAPGVGKVGPGLDAAPPRA
jgi:hypothetical protein